MQQYCTICFLYDWLKKLPEKRRKIKLERKQIIIKEIKKNWTEQDVKLYCINHTIDGTNSAFNYLTPQTISYHILEQNRNLFSNEEYEECRRSIDVQKTLKRG